MKLTSEYVHQYDMCSVASLFRISNIPKYKQIKSFIFTYTRVDAGGREKDCPRDYPDREENFDHHTEKAYEAISIKSVGFDYIGVISLEDCERP